MNNDVVKQVIVVRADLKMRKGKVGAQCAHASNAILLDVLKEIKTFDNLNQLDPLYIWLNSRFVKIVLCVETEEELLELHNNVKNDNIRCSLIEDSGFTEFHGVKTKTCIGIGPDFSHKIDKHTKHLRLY